MHKKSNVEIYHQGWLTKSPPNPRGIFKARWRRRWFTLKQGELPGQFFLEYYTDETCRKRKGIIDLDQVEQVDAGLSLDRASIKFQFMFDMKTPHRTYYLAADSEEAMRNWVMVICQVCNLQETEEKNNGVNESSTIQYYNLGPNADFEAKEITSNETNTTENSSLLTNSTNIDNSSISGRFNNISMRNDYENDNVLQQIHENIEADKSYTNLPTVNEQQRPLPAQRPSKSSTILQPTKPTGAIKKIPENLKLRSDDKINNNNHSDYRASGPYIPLSDCFSGSPVLFKSEGDPKTPLNSLDPKFYENPRSHITNIGLNLTDDQPNSPKRTNIQQTPTLKHSTGKQSVNSSPTDSEGGSTDEEWNVPKSGGRKTRPSDSSSMEDEKIAITAGQSYVRPIIVNNPIPLPPKRTSLVLDKKLESSDTEENVSPIIGPKECTSSVELSYDFPRSYNVQHPLSSSQRDIGNLGGSMVGMHPNSLVTSTPNLIHSGTLERHFYGNAPPREPNVFRFDKESLAMPPPEVNRTLKPRKNGVMPSPTAQVPPPSVDRNLKPHAKKPQVPATTGSLRRKGPDAIKLTEVDDTLMLNDSQASNQSFGLSPKTPGEDRLQYLDLDHTSSPQKTTQIQGFHGTMQSLDSSFSGSFKEGPGVAYTTVDFLKTDAFNRVREDSELTRASKNRKH